MITEELTVIDNLTGLEQAYIKSELREAFCSERLVRTIEIDFLGRINIDTISWDEFWAESPIENQKLNKLLSDLATETLHTFLPSSIIHKCKMTLNICR